MHFTNKKSRLIQAAFFMHFETEAFLFFR